MTPLDVVVSRNGGKAITAVTPKSRELSDGSTIGYAGIAPEVVVECGQKIIALSYNLV